MTLLFDQNISYKAAKRIQDIFPGAKHVSDLRLNGAKDIEIWEFSKRNNFCIVTFDWDFIDLSTLKGAPPKVIWLHMGNTSTNHLVSRIQKEVDLIHEFLISPDANFLEIK